MDKLQQLYLEKKDPYEPLRKVSEAIHIHSNQIRMNLLKLNGMYENEAMSKLIDEMQKHQSDMLYILETHFDKYIPTKYQV